MEPKRQRELALGVVVVALLATAVWRVQSGTSAGAPQPSSTGSTSATTPPAAQRPASQGPKGAATELDLAALEAKRPEPEPSTRNPFRFKPLPPPPAPPASQTPAMMMPTEPVGPPPPPRITLKFIGVMSSNSAQQRVAVLSDTRGGVFYGREGEVIEGQYRILKIGVESLEIAYLDGRGRQTIRQTGQ